MKKYFIKKYYARSALEYLRKSEIHPHFAGYLCIRRAIHKNPAQIVSSKVFKIFFDRYMNAGDAPIGFSYIKPFTGNGKPTDQNQWINDNVAGSYAASSIRTSGPLSQVITVTGNGKNSAYTFMENNAEKALMHLLSRSPISAFQLSIFLFRNFSFLSDTPPKDILEIFKDDFGFSDNIPEQRQAFSTLFTVEGKGMIDDLFELQGE